MRIFGTKRVEPTDEDLAALARLSAVAARFKPAEAVEDVVTDEGAEPALELSEGPPAK
jgi:hypothetical protein